MSDVPTPPDARAEKAPPAERVPDFMNLYSRQVGFNAYTVLHLAEEGPRAYSVNTEELTCSCPDMEYNRTDGSVCKHVAVALHDAPGKREGDQWAMYRASEALDTATRAINRLENQPSGTQASEAMSSSETEPQATQDAQMDVDVEGVRKWWDEHYSSPGFVTVREGTHGGVRGAIIEPESQEMNRMEKDDYKTRVNACDGRTWHLGFGVGDNNDEPCPECGEQDGDYWGFWPASSIPEVLDDG